MGTNESMSNKDKYVIYFNRQINYTIIRNLWFVANKSIKSDDESKDLYKYFEMSKTRYDRICSGGPAIISEKLLQKLEKDMLIERSVFTGEKRLSLSLKESEQEVDSQNRMDDSLTLYAKERETIRIAREENNRADISERKKNIDVEKDRVEEVRKIHNDLKQYLIKYALYKDTITLFKDENMKKLAYFINFNWNINNLPSDQVLQIIESMKKVSFGDLEMIKNDVLGVYAKELKEQYKKISTLIEYRKLHKQK